MPDVPRKPERRLRKALRKKYQQKNGFPQQKLARSVAENLSKQVNFESDGWCELFIMKSAIEEVMK
jgi:hypothetical protein